MNYLDVVSFGDYFFLTTLITFFSNLPNIGINNSFVFMGSKYCQENSATFLFTKLCISKVFILVSGVVFVLFYFESPNIILCIVSGVFFSLFDSTLTYFQSLKRFKEYALLLPIKNIILLFIVFLLIQTDLNPLYGFYIVALLCYVFFLKIAWNNVCISNVSIKKIWLIVGASKYFIIFELMALIMIRTETWIIKYYTNNGTLDESLLGIYGVTITLCTIVSIISNSSTSLLLPYIKEHKNLLSLTNVAIMSLIISSFCAVYIYLSNFSLLYIDPVKYKDYLSIAKYIIAGMALSFIAGVIRINLLNAGYNQYLNRVYIFQFVFSVVCSLYLILNLGVIGASISFFVTRFFGFVFTVSKYVKINT
jgi:O-antigen/teichoic acid export membrane protein